MKKNRKRMFLNFIFLGLLFFVNHSCFAKKVPIYTIKKIVQSKEKLSDIVYILDNNIVAYPYDNEILSINDSVTIEKQSGKFGDKLYACKYSFEQESLKKRFQTNILWVVLIVFVIAFSFVIFNYFID